MSNCLPVSPSQIDVRGLSCLEITTQLLTAYYKVLSGNGYVTVRFQERWSEFQKGNAEGLKEAYMTMYRQCPQAKQSGLPDLAVSMIQRGAPARGLQFFPRM